MLGWGFKIQSLANKLYPVGHYANTKAFAEWDASMFGLKWIENLVLQGKADAIQTGGYPNSYLVRAGVLADILKNGIPDHKGVRVIGDDYVIPGNWKGNVVFDFAVLKAFEPSTLIIVDAWDLS